jgi:hypothetical protein
MRSISDGTSRSRIVGKAPVFERGKDVLSSRGSSEQLPVFVTEENRAKLMAIYDAGLRHWPVPFETFFVDTRFGRTHVIGSGDPAAPPLLMTHPDGGGRVCVVFDHCSAE